MNMNDGTSIQSTCSSEEPHAKASQSRDCEKGSATQGAVSCSDFLRSLEVENLDGLSGKMFPGCFQATEEGILEPSSGGWGNWGTGGHTGSWTLRGSEFRNGDEGCSLLGVLETRNVQQKYFLSQKACLGILRRAEERKKQLPEKLKNALEAVANKTE